MLRRLRHPVPSCPKVSRSSSYVSNFSGVNYVDSGCYGRDHGERQMEAEGHPPVQPPHAGHLPVAASIPEGIATAIAPVPAPTPHPHELATPLLFVDYQMQRTPPRLMTPTASPASTPTGEMQGSGMVNPPSPPGVADRGMWFFGDGYSL